MKGEVKMSKIKPKPCPFCGNEKIAILTDNEINGLDDFNSNYNEHPYFLACCSVLANGCGATGGKYRTVQEAANKWNKRFADAAPVVHGEWITIDGISRCSECGYIPAYDSAIDDLFYSPFCPNCGAKMNEDD